MIIAIVFSVFLSLVALLSFLCDFIFDRINFRLVIFFALLVTLILCFKLIYTYSKNKFNTKNNLFVIGIFFASLLYFVLPAWPDWFPLSLKWDGANHIALINYLRDFSSHKTAVSSHFGLPWGGNMHLYPWGMHSVLAGLAAVFNLNTAFLIHPFISFISALIMASLTSYLLMLGFKKYSIIFTLFILLFSFYMFFDLFIHNHWSQLTGALLGLSLIYMLELSPGRNQHTIQTALILTGIFLIYPLFAMVFYPGLIYVLLKKKYSLFSLLIILIPPLLIAYFYVTQNYYSGLIDDLLLHKAEFKLTLDARNSSPSIFICLASLPAAVYLIWRRNKFYFIFPLIAFFISGITFIIKITNIYNLNYYWIGKTIFLSMILFIPALCFLLDLLLAQLKVNVASGKKFAIYLVLIFLALFAAFPKNNMWEIKPAISRNDYELGSKISATMSDRKVFYVAKSFKKMWLMALFPRIRLELPYHEDKRKVIIEEIWNYNPQNQLSQIMKLAKPGDLIITGRDLLLDKRFKLLYNKEVDLFLWELKNLKKR